MGMRVKAFIYSSLVPYHVQIIGGIVNELPYYM